MNSVSVRDFGGDVPRNEAGRSALFEFAVGLARWWFGLVLLASAGFWASVAAVAALNAPLILVPVGLSPLLPLVAAIAIAATEPGSLRRRTAPRPAASSGA